MELDIRSIGQGGQPVSVIKEDAARNRPQVILPHMTRQEQAPLSTEIDKAEIERYLKDLMHISSAFNRRLKFTINYDLNEVIVKVIDGETDKVIKEIPPEEIRRLYSKMKEAIGLLIDEQI